MRLKNETARPVVKFGRAKRKQGYFIKMDCLASEFFKKSEVLKFDRGVVGLGEGLKENSG